MSVLAYPFMQHAILAALLCSVACGIIGSLIILNRLSYMAGAVAHAAYGGIGIAFIAGLPVMPCALGFSLASSLMMAKTMIRDNEIVSAHTADTALSVLWAGGMALGIILINLSPGYAGDLMGFLFGSILAVPVDRLRPGGRDGGAEPLPVLPQQPCRLLRRKRPLPEGEDGRHGR